MEGKLECERIACDPSNRPYVTWNIDPSPPGTSVLVFFSEMEYLGILSWSKIKETFLMDETNN